MQHKAICIIILGLLPGTVAQLLPFSGTKTTQAFWLTSIPVVPRPDKVCTDSVNDQINITLLCDPDYFCMSGMFIRWCLLSQTRQWSQKETRQHGFFVNIFLWHPPSRPEGEETEERSCCRVTARREGHLDAYHILHSPSCHSAAYKWLKHETNTVILSPLSYDCFLCSWLKDLAHILTHSCVSFKPCTDTSQGFSSHCWATVNVKGFFPPVKFSSLVWAWTAADLPHYL